MVRGFVALLAAVVCVCGVLVPARANLPLASVEALRPIFQHLLGNPEAMQLDIVPDLYPGGYARIVFQVYGEPEVFFHITALLVNSIPVPFVIVDRLERQINPIVDFRTWPVPFRIRSFRQSADGFVLSSQADIGAPCSTCGGPSIQLKP
jgi:hypothetical protein